MVLLLPGHHVQVLGLGRSIGTVGTYLVLCRQLTQAGTNTCMVGPHLPHPSQQTSSGTNQAGSSRANVKFLKPPRRIEFVQGVLESSYQMLCPNKTFAKLGKSAMFSPSCGHYCFLHPMIGRPQCPRLPSVVQMLGLDVVSMMHC